MTKTADNKKQKKDKIDYALRSTLVPKRVLVKTGFPSADAVLESLRILNVVTTESVLAVCSTPDFPFTGAVPEASAKFKKKYIIYQRYLLCIFILIYCVHAVKDTKLN